MSQLRMKDHGKPLSPGGNPFYPSGQHIECLQKLELSLRLRRGLNVVVGDAGTGKTALAHQLMDRLAKDKQMKTGFLPDPGIGTPGAFLRAVGGVLGVEAPLSEENERQAKESIKQDLFRHNIDEKKTIALIIDQGHKIPGFGLEILRKLLNYETNEYKMLQIVVFARREFKKTLAKHKNFADRISTFYQLAPFNLAETRALIRFRLEAENPGGFSRFGFTRPASWSVYFWSGGIPGRVVKLCHLIVLLLVVQQKNTAVWSAAQACARKLFPGRAKKLRRKRWGLLAACLTALVALLLMTYSGQQAQRPEASSRSAALSTNFFRGKIEARPPKGKAAGSVENNRKLKTAVP